MKFEGHLDFNASIPTSEIASPLQKADSKKESDAGIHSTDRGGEDYNPFEVPADLQQAKLHGKAKRVYFQTIRDEETARRLTVKINPETKYGPQVCNCCNFQVGQQIPLRTHLIELSHIGTGYPLYFRFFKYSIGALLAILICSGMYNLISNVREGDCKEAQVETEESYCIEGYNMAFALSNKRDNKELLTGQIALNLVTVIVIIVFFQIMRFRFRKMKIAADEKTTRPSDYTVKLQGIPINATKSEIRAWLYKTFPNENLEIVRVIRAHAINEYIKLLNSCAELNGKRAKLSSFDDLTEKEKMKEIDITNKLAKINQRLEQIQKYRLLNQASIVFVTFKTASEAERVRSFERSWLDIVVEILRPPKDFAIYNYDETHKVKIRRAPEPRDILWENLEFCERERAPTKLFSYVITSLVIFTSFGIILLINWAQGKAETQFGKESSVIQGLSIVASLFIFLANEALSVLTRTIVSYEKHKTYTHHLRAIAKRLAIAQFLNSALSNLFAQVILADGHDTLASKIREINYYGKGGLLENIYWVFVTNALLPPLLTIFDLQYFWKRFKIYLVKRQESKGHRNTLTQSEANKLYEGPTLDLPKRYAMVIKFVLMATFYAPAVPFALVFTIIGLGLFYWANKYMLLRVMTTPRPINTDLTDTMVRYLEGAKAAFAVGNLLYVSTLRNKEDDLAFSDTGRGLIWVTLTISLLHFFLPMSSINEKIFKTEKSKPKAETFHKARLDFITDYDIENPVTHEKAMNQLKALKQAHFTQKRKKSDFCPQGDMPDSTFENSNIITSAKRKESINDDEGQVEFDSLKVYAARIYGEQFTSPVKHSKVIFGMLPRAISKFKRRISERRATERRASQENTSARRESAGMTFCSQMRPLHGLCEQTLNDTPKIHHDEMMSGSRMIHVRQEPEPDLEREPELEPEREKEIEEKNAVEEIQVKKRTKLQNALYHLGIDVAPDDDGDETPLQSELRVKFENGFPMNHDNDNDNENEDAE